MAKVVLGLRKKNPSQKVQLARHMVDDMTGNSHFTTPVPSLTDVANAADDVEQAIEGLTDAREALISAMDHLDQKEKDLDLVLTRLGSYVQDESGGDKEIIESSGAQTQKSGSASPAPVAPVNFLMEEDSEPYFVKASWKGLPKQIYKVKLYELRIKMGSVDAGPWMPVEGGSTQLTYLRFRAPSAGRVWAQVRAKNAAGWGPWSDPATVVVEEPL